MADDINWTRNAAYVGLGLLAVGVIRLVLDIGFKIGVQNYGGPGGVAVAAGQVCAKAPHYGDCPKHLAQFGIGSPNSTNIGLRVAQEHFRAGQQYPDEPNPYATLNYQYAAANLDRQ